MMAKPTTDPDTNAGPADIPEIASLQRPDKHGHTCKPPANPHVTDEWLCPDCLTPWRSADDPPVKPPKARWHRA
jgi:hypothetical protein